MANVETVHETVQGQAQAKQPKPDDGKVVVRETRVTVDEVVTDANSKDAVQTPPEGTTVGHPNPAEVHAEPTVEEKFGTDAAPEANADGRDPEVKASESE